MRSRRGSGSQGGAVENEVEVVPERGCWKSRSRVEVLEEGADMKRSGKKFG